MRVILYLIVFLIVLNSCGKEIEYTGDGNGYFNGIINGNQVISDQSNQKYKFSGGVYFINNYYLCPTNKGQLGFSFRSNTFSPDSVLRTTFYVDGVREVKGKKYENFNMPPNSVADYCKNIPIIYQHIMVGDEKNEAFLYNYIPDKDNYLKIDKILEYHIRGHFKVKFIRKEFMEKGIESPNKVVLPDTLFIECKRFYAHIRD